MLDRSHGEKFSSYMQSEIAAMQPVLPLVLDVLLCASSDSLGPVSPLVSTQRQPEIRSSDCCFFVFPKSQVFWKFCYANNKDNPQEKKKKMPKAQK